MGVRCLIPVCVCGYQVFVTSVSGCQVFDAAVFWVSGV